LQLTVDGKLKPLVITLNSVVIVNVNHTHEILGSVFCVTLSTRTISSMVKVKTMVYGYFRAIDGSDDFLKEMSDVRTA